MDKKHSFHYFQMSMLMTFCFLSCGGDNDPADNTPKQINVESVSINVSTLELTEGDSQNLIVSINPTNASNKKCTFSSSNSEIASVDENGKITAIKAGEATITVATIDGNKTATCTVYVNANYIAVESITLDVTSATLKVGEKMKINATVSPGDATNPSLIWESSDNNIVSVDNEGNIEAFIIGNANVTVSTEDKTIYAICEISVIPEAVTGVSLIEEEIKLMPGDTYQLVASVEPEIANDKNVIWSIADETVATIDETGMVSAKELGVTTVTVTTNDGGYSANCTVNVVDITGMVSASTMTGLYANGVVINGYLQPGSEIFAYLQNESNKTIIPQSMQLIDSKTQIEGNIMEVDHSELASGQGIGYTITVKTTYYQPYIRWRYMYEGIEYIAVCQFQTSTWGTTYY